MAALNQASVSAIESGRYVTNAPVSMDYDYVQTIEENVGRHGKLRIIMSTDSKRFESIQKQRYGSGLYFCFPLGSEDANYVLGH
jgi:hypothetical protein